MIIIVVSQILMAVAIFVLGYQLESHRSYIRDRDTQWQMDLKSYHEHFTKVEAEQKVILGEIARGQR